MKRTLLRWRVAVFTALYRCRLIRRVTVFRAEVDAALGEYTWP